ncbi:HSP20-like chaperone [Colletotrichum falcatum]|nr:HSP20-like chaperone [Colletotrichum falcatum]
MSWAGPNGNNNNNHPFNRSGGPQAFWNFMHSLDPNMRAGAGVDYSTPWANATPGFPWHGSEFGFGGGPGGWGAYGGWGEPRRGFSQRRGGGRSGGRGRHGPHGRHGMNEADDAEDNMRDAAEESGEFSDKEKDDSPDTMRDSPDEGPEGGHPHGPGRHGRGRHGRDPGHPKRGHHPPGPHPPHGPRRPSPPPPPPPPPPPGPHPPFFGGHPHPPPPPPPPYHQPGDLQQWLNQFAGHPLAQQIREWASRFGVNTGPGPRSRGPGRDYVDDESSFTPPADIFTTDKEYVLHFALPGAKKDDIGVDWNAEKGELRVAGVVYRPGDEDFLATMTSSERRIGMFSRSVPLPPAGSAREEIDAPSITAKMEDGILIVTVPKVEKEWTEIHKVDIK